MVVDTSSITAILIGEDDADDLERRRMESYPRRISAANHVELSMVIARSGVQEDLNKLDVFLGLAGVEIYAVTAVRFQLGKRSCAMVRGGTLQR